MQIYIGYSIGWLKIFHPLSITQRLLIGVFRKRNETGIKDVEKKRGASQETLSKLQQQYQQFLTKAAAKV